MNTETLTTYLGADRAARIEALCPGALAAGLAAAEAAGCSGAKGTALAAIRALQTAGCAPTAEDLTAYARAENARPVLVHPPEKSGARKGTDRAPRAEEKPTP